MSTSSSKLVINANSKGDEAEAQQTEVLVQELGVDGLKSVGGCFTLGTGNYDSLSKTFFLAPKPVRACSRSSRFRRSPSGPSRGCPPRWPPTRRLSFDLDNAFTGDQRPRRTNSSPA